jgi:multidrug efflux pump subunit AcrA (membrane-fusion protein)
MGVPLSLLAAVALAAAPATSGSSTPKNFVVVQHCQVFVIESAEVPALEAGPLVQVHVQEGALVKQDELLAQIDDKQSQLMKLSAEAERDAAYERAKDDIDVRYAIKAYELAEAELKQDLDIKSRSPGAVTDAEINRKRLVKTREQLGVDKAKLDQRIARFTANLKHTAVEASIDGILRRRIVAPFDGMVIDVYKHKAEWVNSGEQVLKVVRMDRLRVDGFVNGDEISPLDVAKRPVAVEIELAAGRRERFDGHISFVSPVFNAGNKYRICADVVNRFEQNEPILRPGMQATIMIHLVKGG